jgi:hypothetical protein
MGQFEDKKTPFVVAISQCSFDCIKNGLKTVYYASVFLQGAVHTEITLVFRGEVLRSHFWLNRLYLWFRQKIYGYTVDIETLYITDPTGNGSVLLAMFPNIQRGQATLKNDNTHEDNKAPYPTYPINQTHNGIPLIFVNTSNHAMATHDNNPTLDKIVFIPFKNVKTRFASRYTVELKYKNRKNKKFFKQ